MNEFPKNRITTTAAAKLLGVSTTRIRAMIDAGILVGVRFGRDWQVDSDSVSARKAVARKNKSLRKGGAGTHRKGVAPGEQ